MSPWPRRVAAPRKAAHLSVGRAYSGRGLGNVQGGPDNLQSSRRPGDRNAESHRCSYRQPAVLVFEILEDSSLLLVLQKADPPDHPSPDVRDSASHLPIASFLLNELF